MSAHDRPNPTPSPSRSPGRSSQLPPALRWPILVLGSLLGLVLAAGFAAVALAAIALSVAHQNLPDIGSLTDYRPKLPMRVFSAGSR